MTGLHSVYAHHCESRRADSKVEGLALARFDQAQQWGSGLPRRARSNKVTENREPPTAKHLVIVKSQCWTGANCLGPDIDLILVEGTDKKIRSTTLVTSKFNAVAFALSLNIAFSPP